MPRIAVLSEDLINKIAAGEVVERPASVIKELCENSLDAGARTIRVSLEGGGLERIRIVDDGHGMSREDALLALERHATSKLRDVEGLFAIRTMGFRGEAVPAIASVSRMTLHTCEPDAAEGTRVVLEGGRRLSVEDAPPVPGTTFEIDELFFNTPARRKFLKRESTELSHCEEAVLRLALAHPEVGFFVDHGGRSLLASPPCGSDLRDRIAHIFGAEVHPHLRPVEDRRLGIYVHGQLSLPSFTFPTARGIYTFVNGRFIRDRGLNGAIGRAYGELLPPGRQPVLVLFIEIDPSAVDVNVHPQKLEVRFADPRGIYDAVHGAIARAVRLGVAPAIGDVLGSAPAASDAHYMDAVDRFLTQARQAGTGGAAESPFLVAEGTAASFGQARPELNEAPPPGYFDSLRFLGVLGGRFWICEGRGASLVTVDPHALRERLLLDILHAAWSRDPEQSLPSLFSTVVALSPDLARVAERAAPLFAKVGVGIEPFGGDSVNVSTAPPGFEHVKWAEILPELLRVLAPSPEKEAAMEEVMRRLACAAAASTPAGNEPTHDERRRLFQGLERADFRPRAVHSTLIVNELLWLELERRAGPSRTSERPEN